MSDPGLRNGTSQSPCECHKRTLISPVQRHGRHLYGHFDVADDESWSGYKIEFRFGKGLQLPLQDRYGIVLHGNVCTVRT